MAHCSRCDSILPEGARFCPRCGASVEASEIYIERKRREERPEKWEKHGDRGGAYIGGAILIWLGVSFYIAQYTVGEWWAYFLTGLGVILLVSAGTRYASATYKRPSVASFIAGAVLLLIGGTSLLGIRDW